RHFPPPPHTYTPSLHDALPIFIQPATLITNVETLTFNKGLTNFAYSRLIFGIIKIPSIIILKNVTIVVESVIPPTPNILTKIKLDRKSTRLNSSHASISYAVN